MTPTELAALRAAEENLPPGYDYVLERDEIRAVLAHIAVLESENVSLRGNCARMGQDAKHQARALKRVTREVKKVRVATIEEAAKVCECFFDPYLQGDKDMQEAKARNQGMLDMAADAIRALALPATPNEEEKP